MIEFLQRAVDCAGFVRDDLREAMRAADPVAGIVLIGLIRDAAVLQTKISNLLGAVNERGA